MSDQIPVVVCVDVEPDPRDVDRARPAPWSGFEELQSAFSRLRAELTALTGLPVHFSWFFRMDPQVAETYGSPTWAASTYRRSIDGVRAQGDELGLHTHAFRWDASRRVWIIDRGSQSWVEHCVRTSVAAFRDVLESRCVSFRSGDRWMNDATVRLLEELGVRFDLTLEPGMPGAPGLVPGERHTGALPDLTTVPRHPYRPSRRDFRRPDPSRTDGLWMLPVTTGRPRLVVRHARRLYCQLAGLHLLTDVVPLNLALSPVLFRSVVEPALASPELRLLVIVLRSDSGSSAREMGRLRANVEYVLAHPLAERLVFVTPGEAAKMLGLD